MPACLVRSAEASWTTLQTLYEGLDAEFHFTYKPFSHHGREESIALLLPRWETCRIFCLPPAHQTIPAWLARAPTAVVAVFLLPVETDTPWFHRLIVPHAQEIRFLPQRLPLVSAAWHEAAASMLVIFRQEEPL